MTSRIDTRCAGWSWIDHDVIRKHGPQIGAHAIAVYCVLASYASGSEDRSCWPSYATIGSYTALSRNSVIKALAALKDAGLIGIEARSLDSGGSTSHLYRLLDMSAVGGARAVPGGVHEKYRGGARAVPGGVPHKDPKKNQSEEERLKKNQVEEDAAPSSAIERSTRQAIEACEILGSLAPPSGMVHDGMEILQAAEKALGRELTADEVQAVAREANTTRLQKHGRTGIGWFRTAMQAHVQARQQPAKPEEAEVDIQEMRRRGFLGGMRDDETLEEFMDRQGKAFARGERW